MTSSCQTAGTRPAPGEVGTESVGRAVSHSQTTRGPDAPVPSVSDGIYWTNVVGLGLIHLGAIAGIIHLVRHPSLPTIVLAVTLYTLCGLSITAGYHRLFAHRTYRASAAVRWFFLVFGAAAFQSSALTWSADHRAHHADTDGPGDPHAVARGWWWVHVGWLFHLREASADVSRLTDLYELRSMRLQHRFYRTVAIGVGLVVPVAIASLWGDPWGGLLVAGLLPRRRDAAIDVLRELAGPCHRQAGLRHRRVGPGQRCHGHGDLRRGLSQLSPLLPVRLSQRCALVAVRPGQVVDLEPEPNRSRQQDAPGIRHDDCAREGTCARDEEGAVERRTRAAIEGVR